MLSPNELSAGNIASPRVNGQDPNDTLFDAFLTFGDNKAIVELLFQTWPEKQGYASSLESFANSACFCYYSEARVLKLIALHKN